MSKSTVCLAVSALQLRQELYRYRCRKENHAYACNSYYPTGWIRSALPEAAPFPAHIIANPLLRSREGGGPIFSKQLVIKKDSVGFLLAEKRGFPASQKVSIMGGQSLGVVDQEKRHCVSALHIAVFIWVQCTLFGTKSSWINLLGERKYFSLYLNNTGYHRCQKPVMAVCLRRKNLTAYNVSDKLATASATIRIF